MPFTIPSLARPATFLARRLGAVTVLAISLFLAGCSHDADPVDPASPATSTYTADVATKWADAELKLIRTGTGFTPPVASRALGYTGVALYEAVVPGMADSQSLAGQLTGLSSPPKPEAGQQYNWNVAANSAEALITKRLFGNATTAQRTTVDSLETALNQPYRSAAEFARFQQYIGLDRRVATGVENLTGDHINNGTHLFIFLGSVFYFQ